MWSEESRSYTQQTWNSTRDHVVRTRHDHDANHLGSPPQRTLWQSHVAAQRRCPHHAHDRPPTRRVATCISSVAGVIEVGIGRNHTTSLTAVRAIHAEAYDSRQVAMSVAALAPIHGTHSFQQGMARLVPVVRSLGTHCVRSVVRTRYVSGLTTAITLADASVLPSVALGCNAVDCVMLVSATVIPLLAVLDLQAGILRGFNRVGWTVLSRHGSNMGHCSRRSPFAVGSAQRIHFRGLQRLSGADDRNDRRSVHTDSVRRTRRDAIRNERRRYRVLVANGLGPSLAAVP